MISSGSVRIAVINLEIQGTEIHRVQNEVQYVRIVCISTGYFDTKQDYNTYKQTWDTRKITTVVNQVTYIQAQPASTL